MTVSFERVLTGQDYSRGALADLWGYAGYQALARGVFTPRGDRKIILFVTEEKQQSLEQYSDRLVGQILHWEGPKDHFAEQRMLDASKSGDQIHLFYRKRHHSNFTYLGRLTLEKHKLLADRPSQFRFKVRG